MNLEIPFEEVVFRIEELDALNRAIHERAVLRAQRFLVAEAELLESIIEVDEMKTYEKFGVNYLTTYCVKHLGLAEDVAGILVRVARKSQAVPELRQAIAEGDVSISSARTISSVITKENQSEWIEKAKALSKHKLEREVAKKNGKNYVQVVLNLTEEEFDQRCRIKDLVSQSLGKTATESRNGDDQGLSISQRSDEESGAGGHSKK